MIPNGTIAVGDLEELDDGWSFTVDDCGRNASMCFVFRGRKEANVSRRLMKEIVARSSAISIANHPANDGGLQLPQITSPIRDAGNAE